MKKSIKNIMISIFIFLFICIPKISAETQIKNRDMIEVDGIQVYKYYDNLATEARDYVGGRVGIIRLDINGNEHIGYCVEFGIVIQSGTVSQPESLYEYFRNVLSEEETNELIKKITLYAHFGYGSEGKNTDKYYLATQQLIWEAISDTGFYASDYYYNKANSIAPGSLARIKLDNFRWATAEYEGNKKVVKEVIDVTPEINDIKNAIKQYYRTPSFCSSQSKLELEIGSTATYTDNNRVLSSYEVTCEDGLTCKTNGNDLIITPTAVSNNKKITFNKPSTGTESYLYRVSSGQGVVANNGMLESISCEFGIDTFKNEKTGGMQIAYVIVLGIFCGTIAYITYYTKKSFDELK